MAGVKFAEAMPTFPASSLRNECFRTLPGAIRPTLAFPVSRAYNLCTLDGRADVPFLS